MSNIAYTPYMLSDPYSTCDATLSLQNGQSASTVVTASQAGCSGTFDLVAAVNSTTTNHIKIVVPPQAIIQMMYGEARGATSGGQTAADITMETLGNALGNRINDRDFGNPTTWLAAISGGSQGYQRSQNITNGVQPELTAAANVFSQASPIYNIPNATCFITPTSSDWSAIQQALSSNATAVPDLGQDDPKCYEPNNQKSGVQFVIKDSITFFSDGRPYFIFIRAKQSNDPAILEVQ
jgi:hypothetical protein